MDTAHAAYVRVLREAWPGDWSARACYRGLDRVAIGGTSYDPDGHLAGDVVRALEPFWRGERFDLEFDARTMPDWKAALRWQELMSDDRSIWEFDSNVRLMPSLDIAKQVLDATDVPADHEIIRISRGQRDRTPQTLGWDLSIWHSCRSAVAACLILPEQFFPDEALPGLLDHARVLNEYGLFTTEGDARGFKNWLCRQPPDECRQGDESLLEAIRIDTPLDG